MEDAFEKTIAVCFDLDGTLVDSRRDLARALNRAVAAYGVAPLSLETVTDLIGEGALRLVEKALPEHLGEKIDEVLRRFLAEYEANIVVETVPYPGIAELLQTLSRDRRIAVVTNKPERLSRAVLGSLDLARYVSVVVGPDTAGERKPSPVPLRYALDRLGVRGTGRGIMVGDSALDVQAGGAAGMLTVGVTWGYRPRQELVAADFLVDRPEELPPLIDRQFGSPGRRR